MCISCGADGVLVMWHVREGGGRGGGGGGGSSHAAGSPSQSQGDLEADEEELRPHAAGLRSVSC